VLCVTNQRFFFCDEVKKIANSMACGTYGEGRAELHKGFGGKRRPKRLCKRILLKRIWKK
jgi:hypothetical protein